MTAKPRLKVAAVGAGVWGRNIVRVLKQLELEGLLRLEAIVDVRRDVGAKVAKEWGVPNVLTSIDELEELGVEAVTIAVPVNELAKTAIKAVKRGIHVFVEKPVSTKVEDIELLIRECERTGVIAQPGFIVRYDPVSRKIKELTSDGDPVYVIFKRLSSRPQHRRNVSIIYDLMIHDIDLTGYLLGWRNYKVISAIKLKDYSGIPQSVQATVSFGGVTVTYIADGLLPVKVREVEAYMPDKYVRGVYTERVIYELANKRTEVSRVSGEEPLKAELRDFVLNVMGSKTNSPTLIDALKACSVACDISRLLGFT